MEDLFLQIIDGSHITEYELTNHPSQLYFTGKIYFEDGQEKGARFFKFKESEEKRAKKILLETSKINHERVLKAYFAAYFEPESLWILCYDWFDSLLEDNDMEVRNDYGALCWWWRDEIWYGIILMSYYYVFIFPQFCIVLQLNLTICTFNQ